MNEVTLAVLRLARQTVRVCDRSINPSTGAAMKTRA
jgi:hypothetical protein